MQGPDMELQIVPPVSYESATGIGAVETQQDERLLHHLLGLEGYRELGILERDIVGTVVAE